MDNIQWLFFDVGSTLVDESKVYESRLKMVAETANVSYDYVYRTALEFYKKNKKGDLEIMKLLNVKKPGWRHEDEILYRETVECLKTPLPKKELRSLTKGFLKLPLIGRCVNRSMP